MMKNSRVTKNRSYFLIVSFVIWAAVSLRWILEFVEQRHPYIWLLSALLVAYGLLLGLEPVLTKGSYLRAQIYLVVQSILVICAMLLYYELDFFALLFLPLGGQAMYLLPRKTALAWITIFGVAIVIGQTIQFGWPEGLSFTFLYLAGLIFVASYSTLMIQADEARQESEQLLNELKQANQQLQEYAGQAEELAVANERNRLARELHDSIAQTLYGLTLQAEAASRKLNAGQTGQVAEFLQEIRESTQQTLKETRLLIFELRPAILEEEGLVAALRARLESVESRSGLKARIDLQEVGQLPEPVETGLYGISREVLNNTLKHANASEISVLLKKQDHLITLEISDNGAGFDPNSTGTQGGLGITGVKERVAQIGGKLEISSKPGRGTRVKIEVPYE